MDLDIMSLVSLVFCFCFRELAFGASSPGHGKGPGQGEVFRVSFHKFTGFSPRAHRANARHTQHARRTPRTTQHFPVVTVSKQCDICLRAL